jgi:hypothetical protein
VRLAWAAHPTEGGMPVELGLPFVRAFMGAKLAGLSTPDSFKQYRDDPH